MTGRAKQRRKPTAIDYKDYCSQAFGIVQYPRSIVRLVVSQKPDWRKKRISVGWWVGKKLRKSSRFISIQGWQEELQFW